MDKQIFKRIILENQQEIVERSLFQRSLSVADNMNYAFIGVRASHTRSISTFSIWWPSDTALKSFCI